MKIRFVLFALLLTALPITSCGGGGVDPHYFSKDEHILNVRRIGYITGAEAPYNTMEFGLGSCDLGYPVYNETTGKMNYFFGDTFSQNHQSGQWRSNVACVSSDFNYADGLILDDYLKNAAGYLKPIINGHHSGDGQYEVTKIPTGLVFVNGTIYMYFFSMYDWSANLDNRMNFGGCIKSSNNGETWERIYDLVWTNFSPDGSYGSNNSKESITKLINEDIFNTPLDENVVNIEDHFGFDATQICPYYADDGYIYLFLEGGYRNHPLKLARVTPTNIEKWDEYEYMQGYDNDGNPTYLKGYDGLKALYKNTKAEITTMNFGEMSVVYNPYLNKYCLLTSTTGGVRMFLSDKVYGPYNETYLIYTQGDEICPISSTTGKPIVSAYAPQTHAKMLAENGKKMYMFTSSWIPCYNPSLYEVIFK